MAVLHWEMREILHIMQQEGRLNVLIAMILRANGRLRCYPSLETLVKDTGLSIATVNRAKNWLAECGFITIVSYTKRVDEEIDLNRRHNVYQLTGVCTVDGKEYTYLFMTPEAEKETKERVRNTLTSKVLTSKTLKAKTLPAKDKGVSSSKGTSKKRKGSTTLSPALSPEAHAIVNAFYQAQPGYSADREEHYVEDAEWLSQHAKPQDVICYVEQLRKDDWWAMKVISLSYVRQHITTEYRPLNGNGNGTPKVSAQVQVLIQQMADDLGLPYEVVLAERLEGWNK